ncbi:maleylpyruvate isomerase family mycothiol-dependent enzyme [Leucobacter sp. NPDC058333]|uniref:maleylpyruvate isomerase family mycothiol-dependent enzyme n=1 Tax=Leucobacter sp. NPDC058333 TaxID=3346450 RepID=UPI00364AD87C
MGKRVGAEIWPAVHLERRALIEDLAHLDPAQWRTPSLCAGWSVHDVLAHLVDSAKTTRLGFVRRMLASRFDFDRDNAVGVARERAADPALTLASFRAVSDSTATPPAALATRLVEAFVHGEDIRQPLGIVRNYPPAHVATALRYQVATSIKVGGGRELARGSRLIATDADFQHGEGPEVRATAISLLLAVSGRPIAADRVAGSGASAFVARVNRD